MMAESSAWRPMFASHHHDSRSLDDVAHEPRRVPVRRVGLSLAATAGAACHKHPRSPRRQRKSDLPLPKAVLAFVPAKLRLVPAGLGILWAIFGEWRRHSYTRALEEAELRLQAAEPAQLHNVG